MLVEALTNPTLTRRFWDKVDKTDTCWLWTAALDSRGYGKIGSCYKTLQAHRVSWYFAHGSWPTLHVLHKCDVTNCVNPDHLFLGTQKDNIQDMYQKGRENLTTRASGEAWHKAHGKQWLDRQRDSAGRFA